MPFVFGKRPVIAGFNDSIFAPGECDVAEGIAVAGVAIGKYRENTYAFNTYRDGNDEINNSPSINDRSQMTEVRRQNFTAFRLGGEKQGLLLLALSAYLMRKKSSILNVRFS